MTTFTTADADAVAERLAIEHQAIFRDLMELEDHLGRKLLECATLEGATRERRAQARADLALLWTCYETYRATVVRVREIRPQRSQPTHANLQEIDELVTGTLTVVLPAPDRSPGGSPEGPDKQVTLDELVAEMRTLRARVRDVVTAVDRVWAELGPRIDRCHELLRDAEARTADLGLAADADPAAAVLPELSTQLEAIRRIGLTDPLRLWAEDAVQLAEAEALAVRCELVHAELQALGGLRSQAQPRLDRVTATLAEVTRIDRRILVERHRAHTKIRGVRAPDPDTPARQPLDPRLAATTELHQHGDWRRLATELPALEHAADAARQRAQTELAEAGRPLRTRAELRGRLLSYQAKAAASGRVEDLALEQRYQRARDVLWSAPCDLGVAAAVVAEYQNAVNATVPNGASGTRYDD